MYVGGQQNKVFDSTFVSNPAAQSCNDGEVRLVGGPSPNEGRVEVCLGVGGLLLMMASLHLMP